jgi:hypothetical protein
MALGVPVRVSSSFCGDTHTPHLAIGNMTGEEDDDDGDGDQHQSRGVCALIKSANTHGTRE